MPSTFDRYEIKAKLGQGGMGEVSLALDRTLNRKVALKIINSNNPEAIARFQLEAQAVAKLKHPNIVQVYDFGLMDSRYFFTMDYIDGITLDKLIGPESPPDFPRIARIIKQVADALEYAHSQKIIHRDIKPGNILIDKQDIAYLADFGIAKELTGMDKNLTVTGTTMGTPEYMSPEQTTGVRDQIDHRTDIFSLGSTVYLCLTGRLPFEASHVYDVFNRIITREPVPPRAINKDIPRDMETICLKCLEKDKTKRYQTAGALAADLKLWLNHEPITAVRTSYPARAWRRVMRNKAVSFSLAGILVVLLGLGVWLLLSVAATEQKLAGYRQEARDLFRQGKPAETLAVCDRILELAPFDAEADELRDKCIAAIRKKEMENKSAQEQARIRQSAKLALDRTSSAVTKEEKIKAAQQALEIDPTFGEAYHAIGCVYRDKKDYPNAAKFFTKAIDATPDLAYAYYERAMVGLISAGLNNITKQVQEDLQKVLELDPSSYMGYFAKGAVEFYKSNYSQAIAAYTRAIKLNPDNATYFYSRGAAYESAKDDARAIDDYTRAMQLRPDYEQAYNNRGYIYYRQADYQRALSDFNRAIELDPKDAIAINNRSLIFDQQGDYDSMIADLNAVIELKPQNSGIHFNRGIAYYKKAGLAVRREDQAVLLEKAVSDYTRAIELNPGDIDAYLNRGLAYIGLKQPEAAIEDFNQTIKLNPGYAMAYNYRGSAYHDTGKSGQALADLDRAIALNPDYDIACHNRGAVYYDLDQPAKAIDDFSRAIKLYPQEPMSYFMRAQAYAKNGQFPSAIADGEYFLTIAPEHDKATALRLNLVNWKMQQPLQPDKKDKFTNGPSIPSDVISSWGRQKDFFLNDNFQILEWESAKTLLRMKTYRGGKQYHTGWLTIYTHDGRKYLTKQPVIDAFFQFMEQENLSPEEFGTE